MKWLKGSAETDQPFRPLFEIFRSSIFLKGRFWASCKIPRPTEKIIQEFPQKYNDLIEGISTL